MFGFAKALLSAHGQKAMQEVTDKIVDLDPATATQAQLQMMEQALDKVGLELAKVRTEATQEHTEANAIQGRFDTMNRAAAALNAKYEAETDPAKKADLEKSLNGLLSTMEGIKTDLGSSLQHAKEADDFVAEVEKVYNDKAEQLRTAKAKLQDAARDLGRAKIDQERANEQAEHSAEIAGLRDNKVDGLDAALNSMKRQTDAARGDAEAKRLKASVLTKADPGSVDDPNVLSALAEVQSAPSNQSFADRLAALQH